MRSGWILFLLPAVLLGSCSPVELPAEESVRSDTVRMEISLDTGAFHTRADADETVDNVKIFVFDPREQLSDSYDSATTDLGNVEVLARKPVSIYALVNAPGDFSAVKTKSQLLQMRSSITDNTPSRMVMVGHVDTTVTASGPIVIPVRRIAAKILVEEIYGYFRGCGNTTDDAHQINSLQIYTGSADWPYALDEGTPGGFVDHTAAIHIGYRYMHNPRWTTRTLDGRTYYYYGPAAVYTYPNHETEKSLRTRLVLFLHGARTEDLGNNHYLQHDCYHYISFLLPPLDANTLYRIPRLTVYMPPYDYSPSYASRELRAAARARVESYDMQTGEMKGHFTLEEPAYVEEIAL